MHDGNWCKAGKGSAEAMKNKSGKSLPEVHLFFSVSSFFVWYEDPAPSPGPRRPGPQKAGENQLTSGKDMVEAPLHGRQERKK